MPIRLEIAWHRWSRRYGEHLATLRDGPGGREIGDERRGEERLRQRVPVVVAVREDRGDARELPIGLVAARGVRPGAQLLHPSPGEVRVGGELAGEVEDAPARHRDPAEPERSGERDLLRVGLRMEVVAVLLPEELPHRIERLMTGVAGRALRRMRLIDRGDRGWQRGVLRADRVPERGDQRLVGGDARLFAAVGVRLGQEGGGGEETDPRRAQQEVTAGAEVHQVEDAADALGRSGLDDLDHLPLLAISDRERLVGGGGRRRLSRGLLAGAVPYAGRLGPALL